VKIGQIVEQAVSRTVVEKCKICRGTEAFAYTLLKAFKQNGLITAVDRSSRPIQGLLKSFEDMTISRDDGAVCAYNCSSKSYIQDKVKFEDQFREGATSLRQGIRVPCLLCAREGNEWETKAFCAHRW
jgi:hypothetical protein